MADARAIPPVEQPPPDLWRLVWGQPYIDARTLARAIVHDLQRDTPPDFRTRLLVRDSARALESFWGTDGFRAWLEASPVGERISEILGEPLGQPGFRGIRRRLVDRVARETVEQIFELVGRRLRSRVEVTVAGSIPTLLAGLTSRPTDDIDIVDEVPAAIRQERAVLDQVRSRYGLTLGHVQSHYLPANWQTRRAYFGDFGNLRVYLADPVDVFVSKLSSVREKHQDDLRVMAGQLDREEVRRRVLEDGRAFLEVPVLRARIEANWQFIYRVPWVP